MSDQAKKKMSMNDYTIQKVIGEGSYGRAILCKEKETGNQVVIKEIALSSLSSQEQKEAWKETKILSLLHHPNIINYKGSFMQNNCLHIVMDFADGGDLFGQIQKAKKQHFKEDQIIDWFVQICLALKHIHDRKILHRDIKCQNIFLMKNGVIKMGDFGIAKVLDYTTQFSKTAIGTPYYLSPEICQGKAYNAKSDVWSLGCVLYELCTLQHAFDSNCMNGLIMKILRSKHSPIPYFYSANLRNLVDSLLQKAPNKRPSINQILKLDFIRERIGNWLSATVQRIEFSHTVFHHVKGGVTPKEAQKPPPSDELPVIAETPVERPKAAVKPSNPPKVASKPAPRVAAKPANVAPPAKPVKASVPPARVDVKPFKAKAPREIEKPVSKDGLLAKKNAAVHQERERQKELKEKKAEEERAAQARADAKRAEVLEKAKKREQERKDRMKLLKQEAKASEQKYKNLEAPFKKAMGPLVAAKQQAEVQETVAAPVAAKKKLEVKNVTKRPGKVRDREEEVRSLREMMARKRAEIKKMERERQNQECVIIGGIEVPAQPAPAPAPAPKPSPPPKPEPVKKPEPIPSPPKPVLDPKPEPEPEPEREPELPKKSLMDQLMEIPSEDESDDDLLSLAAIAQNIFDDPPSSDEDEGQAEEDVPDEEDEKEEILPKVEEKREASQGRFFFGGKELKLDMVTDRDSMNYRIEALRQFIEEGLGLDKFIEVYQFITEDSDALDEKEADIQLRKMLSAEQIQYYPLVQQLIVCEESLNDPVE